MRYLGTEIRQNTYLFNLPYLAEFPEITKAVEVQWHGYGVTACYGNYVKTYDQRTRDPLPIIDVGECRYRVLFYVLNPLGGFAVESI